MLNKIILIGRLTRDPELRYTQSGTPVASFTLAVERPRSKNGEKVTDFISIVVWNKLAELCAQYLSKGRLAAVDGRLETRQYDDREGKKVRVFEVVADQVKFLDRGETKNEPQPSRNQSTNTQRYEDDPFADAETIDISDEDLPF